ncbi:MAG: motility associated factor glycosyltransferase family protein [Deltaproteobacteria bacterium]|nr:motility associated factor glycosyltransferase family protein [Candidatus Tharpella sp.]
MKLDKGAGFYEKNLRVLKKVFPLVFSQVSKISPELPQNVIVVESMTGTINLVTTLPDGTTITLYKEQDPLIEAQEIFGKIELNSCDFLFFMGMGLGYHALTAVHLFSEKPSLIIFEPSLELFILSLHYLDLTPFLSYSYLDLYVGSEINICQDVEKYISPLLYGETQLLACFPPVPFSNSSYEAGYKFLKEWLKSKQEGRVTLERSSRRIFQNCVENLPSLFAGQSLGHLRGALQGVPAFCVAAGPSLDAALTELKKVGNKALIIALDSAVQALVEAGIKPHVVVTADFKELNFEKLRDVLAAVRESILIFALGANVKNVSTFLGQRRIGVTPQTDSLLNWFGRHLDIDCQVPNITSVGQTALFTAAGLGLDPIVLVGMDLAFPEGLDHATNTVFRSRPHPDRILLTTGVAGNTVSSQAALIADKVQIEKVVAEIDTRVVNTSMQGVLLQGTEARSLEEVIECELKSQTDVTRVLAGLNWNSSITISEIINVYKGMLHDVSEFSQDCETGQSRVEQFFGAEGQNDEIQYSYLAKKVINYFATFKNRWSDIGNLLSAARFKEFQAIKRRQIRLEKSKMLMAANEVTVAEIEIIRDDLSSLLVEAQLFFQLMQTQLDYLQKLEQLPMSATVNQKSSSDELLVSAEVHRQGKQYWQAECDYRSIMAGDQNYLAALCGLADIYCDLGLWVVLQNLLQSLEKKYLEAEVIQVYRERLEQKIADIFSQTKGFWLEGRKEETRRCMMKYLKLVPDDREILALRDAIYALDEEDGLQFVAESKEKEKQAFSEPQLLHRAQAYLNNGEPEPAIGILVGLVRKNSKKGAFYREKIGDIRLHQKDLRSALWHYRQVFADDMLKQKLQEKIAQLQLESAGK